MGRALSTALALILFYLVALTCALSATNSSSGYIHGPDLHSYMSLRDIRLFAGYCCKLICFCVEVDNATAEQCQVMQDRIATLSPSLCASASQNSSSTLCPPSGAALLCNSGASCCTNSCNQSCTSKLDVCACPCNHCSTCSCCTRIENRLCRLRCKPCDKVWMMLDFQDQLGKPHSVNFSRNFILNSAEAQNFYDAYKGISSIIAYYKSADDPTVVDVAPVINVSYADATFLDVSEDYPVGRDWAAFGIFSAFPIFTVSVLLTGLLIALLLQRMRRADQRPFRIAWSVNRGLWMGIIWPLIIVLLILQVRYPAPRYPIGHAGGIKLSILVLQLITCIGWLPLLLLWLYHIIHPQL